MTSSAPARAKTSDLKCSRDYDCYHAPITHLQRQGFANNTQFCNEAATAGRLSEVLLVP